jgi:hypothetical protein
MTITEYCNKIVRPHLTHYLAAFEDGCYKGYTPDWGCLERIERAGKLVPWEREYSFINKRIIEGVIRLHYGKYV